MEGAEASAVGPAPFSLELAMERLGWKGTPCASHTSPERRAGRLCRRGRAWWGEEREERPRL